MLCLKASLYQWKEYIIKMGGGGYNLKKMGHQRPVFGSNVTNELDTIDTKWLRSPNLR